MKATNRSTALQAILRTALVLTILLSFPATIMAYEETLDNGLEQFNYTLSGNLEEQGDIVNSRPPRTIE